MSENFTFFPSIESTEVPNLNSIPLLASCFLSSPDVLLSKPGKISLSNSTTVTSDSKSFNKLANSHPIAPAPIMHTFLGGCSQFRAVSDVITNSSSTSILGIERGLEPVAKTM